MSAVKFFSSSNDEDQEAHWLQNPWRKDAVASTRNMMNWGKFAFYHNLRAQSNCIELHHFASPLMALQIILIYV